MSVSASLFSGFVRFCSVGCGSWVGCYSCFFLVFRISILAMSACSSVRLWRVGWDGAFCCGLLGVEEFGSWLG